MKDNRGLHSTSDRDSNMISQMVDYERTKQLFHMSHNKISGNKKSIRKLRNVNNLKRSVDLPAITGPLYEN